MTVSETLPKYPSCPYSHFPADIIDNFIAPSQKSGQCRMRKKTCQYYLLSINGVVVLESFPKMT